MVMLSILPLGTCFPSIQFFHGRPLGRDGAGENSSHMMHDGRQVIGPCRGRHDEGGPTVLVQWLEVLGPGPAMELDNAIEAIDKA